MISFSWWDDNNLQLGLGIFDGAVDRMDCFHTSLNRLDMELVVQTAATVALAANSTVVFILLYALTFPCR